MQLPDKVSLCEPEKNLVLFPERRNLEDGKTLCASHGGKIFTSKNEKENERFFEIVTDEKVKVFPVANSKLDGHQCICIFIYK